MASPTLQYLAIVALIITSISVILALSSSSSSSSSSYSRVECFSCCADWGIGKSRLASPALPCCRYSDSHCLHGRLCRLLPSVIPRSWSPLFPCPFCIPVRRGLRFFMLLPSSEQHDELDAVLLCCIVLRSISSGLALRVNSRRCHMVRPLLFSLVPRLRGASCSLCCPWPLSSPARFFEIVVSFARHGRLLAAPRLRALVCHDCLSTPLRPNSAAEPRRSAALCRDLIQSGGTRLQVLEPYQALPARSENSGLLRRSLGVWVAFPVSSISSIFHFLLVRSSPLLPVFRIFSYSLH